MPCKLRDRDDWFDMWLGDRRNMADVMRHNMAADLAAGYDPAGISIMRQKVEIHDYEQATDRQLDAFKHMNEVEVNRWCFYDMKKRGVID